MKLHFERTSFSRSLVGAVTVLLFTGALAHGQVFYQYDWGERFNNSQYNETEDNWVANAYTAAGQGIITSITLPIGDTFTNKPISALIYQGFDVNDPTAGGGLILLAEKDTTFSSVPGTILTVTFDDPVIVGARQVFYAAVLIPSVPSNVRPFFNDVGVGGLGSQLQTQALGHSFFDVALTRGGAYDVNQLPANSSNITVFGGVHPVMGGNPGDVQDPGNLALWVNGQ